MSNAFLQIISYNEGQQLMPCAEYGLECKVCHVNSRHRCVECMICELILHPNLKEKILLEIL